MALFFKKKKNEETAVKVTNEVPAEIIAVIAAAVAYTLGSGVKVLSVRRAEKGGRSSWSLAGLLENTRPF
jgi:hypothetical protein